MNTISFVNDSGSEQSHECSHGAIHHRTRSLLVPNGKQFCISEYLHSRMLTIILPVLIDRLFHPYHKNKLYLGITDYASVQGRNMLRKRCNVRCH